MKRTASYASAERARTSSPTPSTSSASSSQNNVLVNYPVWEKHRKDVQEDLWNIVNWSKLISVLESLVANNIKVLTPEIKLEIHHEFDTLLTKFPLLSEYWKRYATIEYSLNGIESSVKIFERAVNAFPNSLELWIDYISVITSNSLESSENIKILFEEAASKIGRQFLSDSFWDIYLEWQLQETGENSNEYMQILLNIIEIPLHQYARYFTRFDEIRPKFAPADLIPQEKLERLAVDKFAKSFESLSSEEIESAAEEYFNNIFTTTQLGTNSRWQYESELTSQTFEVSLVDPKDTKKWIDYIEFEISENLHRDQIKSVFERALVPTCLYDKIWLKYLSWMIEVDDSPKEEVIYVFDRVCDVFIPIDQPKIRYFYATYLNYKLNDFKGAKKIYIKLMEGLPVNSEVVSRLFKLFIENKGEEKCIENGLNVVKISILNSKTESQQQTEKDPNPPKKKAKTEQQEEAIPVLEDEDFREFAKYLNEFTTGQLIVEIAKIYWLKEKDIKKTRSLLISYFKEKIVRRSESYWNFFVKFELAQKNVKNLTNIKNYVQLYSKLPTHIINNIMDIHVDLQFKNATNTSELAKAQRDIIRTWLETDKESSYHTKHYLKARQSDKLDEEATNKKILIDNGHPGIPVEARPRITNLIDFETSLLDDKEAAYPLPNFTNVEKASVLPQYIKDS